MNEPRALPRSTPLPARVLSAAGHYWTIAPVLVHAARHALRPRAEVGSAPWSASVPDAKFGRARLSGVLHEPPGGAAEGLVIIVHGLGGDLGSHYTVTAARAAAAAGFASLRLNLRGAGGSGEAFYHAGFTDDIHAAIASPELARYERLYLVGYSLGGHLALRSATEPLDGRVRAVVAVCAPIDLHGGARAIDEPQRFAYRRFVLDALHAHYAAVARRHPLPIPADEARRIHKIREWDERIVAPWFGFDSADHYYAEAGVAPRLQGLALPALIVAAEHDPMIPGSTVRPTLDRLRAPVEVRWIDHGGHVGFPASAHLGLPGPPGLEPQIMAWLTRHR